MPQIKKLKFHDPLYNFDRANPRSIHEFLGAKLLCTFRQNVVWSFFSPYGPMLTKTKKKLSKVQILIWYRPSLEALTFWEWICYVLSEEMSFEVFPPYNNMLTKTKKKIVIKSKMQNFEKKNGVEIWWKGTFPPNLSLIYLTEKRVLRTTDGHPRDDSSSAVQ